MHHDAVGSAELMALRARRISGAAGPRIHALDNRKTVLADAPQNAHRAQQPGGVIDEKKKGHYRDQPKGCGSPHDETRNGRLDASHRSKREQQRENEQTNRKSNDVVTQRRCGDDARRQLPARDLNGNEVNTIKDRISVMMVCSAVWVPDKPKGHAGTHANLASSA
jgi:hypothetical protein